MLSQPERLWSAGDLWCDDWASGRVTPGAGLCAGAEHHGGRPGEPRGYAGAHTSRGAGTRAVGDSPALAFARGSASASATRTFRFLRQSSVAYLRRKLGKDRDSRAPGSWAGDALLAHGSGDAAVVFVGVAIRVSLDCHSGLDAECWGRHSSGRTLCTDAGTMDLQGVLGAAAGALQPPLVGAAAGVDGP